MTIEHPDSVSEAQPTAISGRTVAVAGMVTAFLTTLTAFWLGLLAFSTIMPGSANNSDGGLGFGFICCAPAIALIGAVGGGVAAGHYTGPGRRPASPNPVFRRDVIFISIRSGLAVGLALGLTLPFILLVFSR